MRCALDRVISSTCSDGVIHAGLYDVDPAQPCGSGTAAKLISKGYADLRWIRADTWTARDFPVGKPSAYGRHHHRALLEPTVPVWPSRHESPRAVAL